MTLQGQHFYDFGPFRLDAGERVLLRHGQPVPLTPKALHILQLLVENHGHIVEKGELMREVWPDTFVEDVNLARHISTLRKVLGSSPDDLRYIETVARRGYRFAASVNEVREGGTRSNAQETVASDTVMRESISRESDQGTANTTPHEAPGHALRYHFRGRSRKMALILAVLVLVAIGGGIAAFLLAPGPPSVPMSVIPLTSFPGSESQAAFSRRGDQIAFVWDGADGDNSDIYIKSIDTTSQPLRLTTSPAPDMNPVWSPDGRHIAFLRQSGDRCGVYLIPILGGPERKLGEVSQFSYGTSLDWFPDGKYLAVVDRATPEEPHAIVSLSVETGEKRRLTSPPVTSNGDSNPAVSPDGATLAFIRIGIMGVSEIFLLPLAGGEPTPLTSEKATIIGLAWTPDARQIVFRLSRGAERTLWTISTAGGKPQQLQSAGLDAVEPATARQGRRLAFSRRSVDSNIWRIDIPALNVPLSPPTKLISSTRSDVSPQISPDGRMITFVSDRSGRSQIWVCDKSGSNLRELSDLEVGIPGSPRWSPDSQQIAFDTRFEGQGDIYIVSVEGGRSRRLTLDDSEDVAPSWSQDGRWVYFGSYRTGDWQIWKVPSRGGPAVQVTKKGGFAAFESPDSSFIYYSKFRDFARPLWRMPVGGNEEEPVPGFSSAVRWGHWALIEKGICFINSEGVDRPRIEFFTFATGHVRRIAEVERKLFNGPGLSISPDGRWVVYAQIDRNDSDLMLLERF